jgi:NADH dehydrogenase FAD-containing subunit
VQKPDHHGDTYEIHFPHSAHLESTSNFVCGVVSEVTPEEVVVVLGSRKAKEIARIRFDCLVICSGRRYHTNKYYKVYASLKSISDMVL